MPTAVSIPVRPISPRRRVANRVESLEKRTMLSVAINSQGWTVVTPPAGTRIIYCSATGSDAHSGLSAKSPVRSLARAESLLQNHTGDELLLKAGDVFYGNFIFWKLSGASAQDPMVVGSYGSGARPEIMTGTRDGLETGSVSARTVNYVDILGINFCANGRDPNLTRHPATKTNPAGVQFLTRSDDITVENCQFEYYSVDINFQDYLGPIENVSIRRNIITDAYAVNAHAQGVYATGVHNLTIDGNDFDANGYNYAVGAQPTVFNQDCYLAYDDSNCVVENNIFARAASTGLEDRPGGIVKDNTFIDDPVGMNFGLVNGAKTTAGGVTGAVTGNVFIGGGNIGRLPEGQGLDIGNIRSTGAVISGNVFTQGGKNRSPAIELSYGIGQIDPWYSVGVNNLTIESNVIYDWSTGIAVASGLSPGGRGITALNDVKILNNQFENLTGPSVENHSSSYLSQEHFSGNVYHDAGQAVANSAHVTSQGTTVSHALAFPDPDRSVASYDAAIGNDPSISDFLARAARQTAANWNTSLTGSALAGYITQGFGLTGAPVVIPPVTTTGGSGSSGGTQSTPRLATSTFAALDYSSHSGVANDGYSGISGNGGNWAEYSDINFGSGATTFKAEIAALAKYAGYIDIHLDSPTGTMIGSLRVQGTGGWDKNVLQTTAVAKVTGVHNLYLVFVGGKAVGNLLSFRFE